MRGVSPRTQPHQPAAPAPRIGLDIHRRRPPLLPTTPEASRPVTALIYLIGAPGSGKSTVMAAATAHLHRTALPGRPARDLLTDTTGPIAVELGARRGSFSGTDALPMDAVRHAEAWLRDTHPGAPLVLGEGARLGNARFLQAAVQAG